MLLESTNAMTELLCLSDAYRCEFDAVALDATAFFPTGGGQPNDIGELTFADMSAAIVDVVKNREGIA
jgi:Ser-tRNA(Ala) deacylase AlaX